MDFKTTKPIYQQIADLAFQRILSGAWKAEERVPSVRELAVELAVNTHTVLKAYEYLQAEEIIYSRRGMGFFLASDAKKRVDHARKEEFFSTTLVDLFEQMRMLGITWEEVEAHYRGSSEEAKSAES